MKAGTLNILVVHNFYQQAGGEKTAVEAQLALLRDHGHRVTLYSRDNRELEQYGWRDWLGFAPETLFSRRTYREVRALVRRLQPDVAHLHNVFPLISPAVYHALDDEGVPMAQTLHNFRFLCPNSLFYTQGAICERCRFGNTLHAVRYRCYRDNYATSALYAATIGGHRWHGAFDRIDRFLCLTEFAAHKLVESGFAPRERLAVLGNFLAEPLPAPGPEQREPSLLFLGRLSPEKGVALLLEAMRALPGVGLTVLGDGPERGSLEARAAELALDNVTFAGFLAGEAKWSLLRQATATVVPSLWYENFPFAALESMAVGTPVVAPALGSFPFIVQEGESGLLFPPGDAAALAARLQELIERPRAAAAMGQRARAIVAKRYVASAHYRGLMAIYEELIAERAARAGARGHDRQEERHAPASAD